MTTVTTRHSGLIGTLARSLRPLLGRPIRIEEHTGPRAIVVRAEVPGIEPEDIAVVVADGELTIAAHHRTRTVRLPEHADEDAVSAAYRAGVLEVTVGLAPPSPIGRVVPVVAGADAKPPEGHLIPMPAGRAGGRA